MKIFKPRSLKLHLMYLEMSGDYFINKLLWNFVLNWGFEAMTSTSFSLCWRRKKWCIPGTDSAQMLTRQQIEDRFHLPKQWHSTKILIRSKRESLQINFLSGSKQQATLTILLFCYYWCEIFFNFLHD